MNKKNKLHIFSLMIIFSLSLISAAPNAPTDLIFSNNATATYDEGVFFVNWTSGAGDSETNYSIYVFSNDTLYLKADNNSVTGYTFSNTTEANYTFIIEAVNNTGIAANSTTNISIYVDSTSPIISLPEYTNATIKRNTDNLTLNISVSDSLSGLTGAVCLVDINGTNESISISSGWCNSSSLSLTGLSDGNNIIKIYVNDTVGNLGINDSFVVTLDSTSPTVSLSSSTIEKDRVILAISTTGTSCTSDRGTISGLTLTDTSVECGEYYTYNVTCTDDAGNSASVSASYYTLGCGSSSSVSSFWKTTFLVKDEEFIEGISKDLMEKSRMKIKVNNQDHYVGVLEITPSNAKIQVSSTPQEAILKIGESKKFDITGDNYYDILVTLNSIISNKAKITISSISENILESSQSLEGVLEEEPYKEDTSFEASPITGEIIKDEIEKPNIMWLWGTISIIILIALIYFLRYKIKKNKN